MKVFHSRPPMAINYHFGRATSATAMTSYLVEANRLKIYGQFRQVIGEIRLGDSVTEKKCPGDRYEDGDIPVRGG